MMASRSAREVERRQEQRAGAVVDIADRRELLLAVAPAVARWHEDHPGRSDRRHVLGVVARAGADPAVASTGRTGGALHPLHTIAVERCIGDAPVVLELIPHALALTGVADDPL